MAAPYLTWLPPDGVDPDDLLVLSGHRATGIMLGSVGGGRPVATGFDMPSDSQFETELAATDGSIATGRRRLPREGTLPILIVANSLEEKEAYRRELFRTFNPRLGFGTLIWAMPDGSRRRLSCRYRSGFESSGKGRLDPNHNDYYSLVLRAVDPYFYGDLTGITFTPTPVTGDFFPGPPFFISDSRVFGTQDVEIDGEDEAYPEWLLVGPATSATLTNVDTGETLSLTLTMTLNSHTLTIRTDPRVAANKKFVNQAGTNVWASVAGQFPALWSLQPGNNTITVTMGGTAAGSGAALTYSPRYLSA